MLGMIDRDDKATIAKDVQKLTELGWYRHPSFRI